MRIYRLDFDVNNYKSIELCEDIYLELYPKFDGRRLKPGWIAPKVREREEDEKLRKGDAPGFILPTLNKKALDVLLPLIEKDTEILPLNIKDGFLYGINVTTLLDAVNYDLSEYKTFSDGKKIMRFEKLVLVEERLKNHNIFKLIDLPRGSGNIFVSEMFVECIKENHLEGFKFNLVYCTEERSEEMDDFTDSSMSLKSKMDNSHHKYLYNEQEVKEIDKYIVEKYGSYAKVLHEIVSPDIHLDICIVDPSKEEPFYKLITMGAGAYRMTVPQKYEKYDINYAEYIICLPKDWNLESSDENDYWPIRLIKTVARLPIEHSTWLTYGHTVQADEKGTPYASNTKFNSVVIDFSEDINGDARVELSNGKKINFYLIIPLYPEELQFKIDNGVDSLIQKFVDKNIDYKVLNLQRKNVITD